MSTRCTAAWQALGVQEATWGPCHRSPPLQRGPAQRSVASTAWDLLHSPAPPGQSPWTATTRISSSSLRTAPAPALDRVLRKPWIVLGVLHNSSRAHLRISIARLLCDVVLLTTAYASHRPCPATRSTAQEPQSPWAHGLPVPFQECSFSSMETSAPWMR